MLWYYDVILEAYDWHLGSYLEPVMMIMMKYQFLVNIQPLMMFGWFFMDVGLNPSNVSCIHTILELGETSVYFWVASYPMVGIDSLFEGLEVCLRSYGGDHRFNWGVGDFLRWWTISVTYLWCSQNFGTTRI